MKVISFLNQKGGTGKTTSCINVGARLAQKGFNVLLIDVDPQGSLTTSLAINTEESDTLYEVLKGEADANDVIVKHGNYSVLPTDLNMSGAEIELVREVGAEQLMRTNVINKLKESYDFILLDCPPALNIFTVMSLAASDGVIIPLQAQFLPYNGIMQLQKTITKVKERINPGLEILGYVFTMHDRRKNLEKQVADRIEAENPGKTFNITISNNIALAEAQAMGKDIFEYDPKAKGAVQYTALTAEILERI